MFYETIDRQRFHDRQLFIGVFVMYQIYHLKYFSKLALFQPVVIADQFPFSTGDLHTGFSGHFGSRAQINCARIERVEWMPLSPITRHSILIITKHGFTVFTGTYTPLATRFLYEYPTRKLPKEWREIEHYQRDSNVRWRCDVVFILISTDFSPPTFSPYTVCV